MSLSRLRRRGSLSAAHLLRRGSSLLARIRRREFPLWTKLGALFGGVYGLGVAVFGVWDGWSRVELEDARRRTEMEMLAQVVAAGIDADAHAQFRGERDRGRPEFAAAVHALRHAVEGSSTVTWAGTSTRDGAGNWSYVVDASRRSPIPVGYPIFDGVLERDRAWSGEVRRVEGLLDEAGSWHTVFAPIRSPDGAVVGLVELTSDADQERLVLLTEIRRAALQLTVVVLVGLGLAFVFGRLLSRHLQALVIAARRVSGGDLATRVAVTTHDEIGVLAASFNQMLDGLREREFIRDTFGRFVNPDVVDQILEDRQRLELGGEVRVVTVLASDLRGFTALCDERGPERIVALLNRYLQAMMDVVDAFDGNVSELVGDGMIVLFGAPISHPNDAWRAVACAVEMQRALERFNEAEGEHLRMGIGIDTGTVIAGNIGAERHMKYGVVGSAINLAARLESFTLGNQVLASESTLQAAGDVEVDPVLEIRAKGRKTPLRGYPVRAAGPHRMPVAAAREGVDVDASGSAARVYGKQVDSERFVIRVVRVDSETVALLTDAALHEREDLELAFSLDGAEVGEIYGTVAHVEERRVTVRLTAVPVDVRGWIEGFLAARTASATARARG